MFCSRCGTRLPDTARVCSHCGLDLTPTTPIKAIAGGEVTEQDIVREALAADFEILEELGRGGMAIVYRARDRQLDRDVAIKVLPFSLAFDTEFVERFQREARTAAQLEHPNIIPIYRVGKAGRVTFFVMKYLRGHSLSHILGKRGRLTPPEIRRLLIEAGGALAYAARRGTVHRDIKPDNIMFDDHGVCMVADFGIAKAASGQRLTGTGMSIGTPHYMSPEQARAQDTDGRSDIYSLGIVAYQCLTGHVPYDGEDSFAIGYKHIMEPIPMPVLETPDERRLFEVIRKMIAKDPKERFQNGDEMIAALEGQAVASGIRSSNPAIGAVPGAGVITPRSSPGIVTPRAAPGIVTPRASAGITTPRASTAVPTPRPTGPVRRPVARRTRTGPSGVGAGVLALVLLGGVAGGGYWYFGIHNRKPPGTVEMVDLPVDSSPAAREAAQAAADSAALLLADSTTPDSAARDSAAAAPTPPATSNPTPPLAASTRAAAPSRDSGEVRISGLPRGSTVLIDEQPMTTAEIRLPAGPHVLAISAPRHQFFTDTIRVERDVVLQLEPILVPLGAPLTQRSRLQQRRLQPNRPAVTPTCAEPVAGYNADRSCYDQRPRPVKAPFIALTPAVEGTPRASVLLIKVSAQGRTLDVRPFTPSNDTTYERLAREYARDMDWHPATKDGKPVEGWTQMAFPPVRE